MRSHETSLSAGLINVTNVSIYSLTGMTTSSLSGKNAGIMNASTGSTSTITTTEANIAKITPILLEASEGGHTTSVNICTKLTSAVEGQPLDCYGTIVDSQDKKEYSIYTAQGHHSSVP